MENVPSSAIITIIAAIIAMAAVVMFIAMYNGQNDAAVQEQSRFSGRTNTAIENTLTQYDGETFDGTQVMSIIGKFKDSGIALMTRNTGEISPSFFTYKLLQQDGGYILGDKTDYNTAVMNAANSSSASYVNPENDYTCALIYSKAGNIIGMSFTQGNTADSYPVVEVVKPEAHATYYVVIDTGISLPAQVQSSLESNGWTHSSGTIFKKAYTDGTVTLPTVYSSSGTYRFDKWVEVKTDSSGKEVTSNVRADNTVIKYTDGTSLRKFKAQWISVSVEKPYKIQYYFKIKGSYPDVDNPDITVTKTAKTGETVSISASLSDAPLESTSAMSSRLVRLRNDAQYQYATSEADFAEILRDHYFYDETRSDSTSVTISNDSVAVVKLYYKEMHTVELYAGEGAANTWSIGRYEYGTPYSEIQQDYIDDGLPYLGGNGQSVTSDSLWEPYRDSNGNPIWLREYVTGQNDYGYTYDDGDGTTKLNGTIWQQVVSDSSAIVDRDVRFELQWQPQKYAVILNAGTGTISSSYFQEYPAGKTSSSDTNNYYRYVYAEGDNGGNITLPDPTPQNSSDIFTGWTGTSLPDDGKTVSTKRENKDDTFNGNLRFTATYGNNKDVVIRFSANGGTLNNNTSSYIKGKAGTTVTTPYNLDDKIKVSRRGYTFSGWYTSSTGGTRVTTISTMPINSVTYYAHWTPIQYKITYNLNGGTVTGGTMNGATITAYPTMYSIEDVISLNAPAKTGCAFTNWVMTYTTSDGTTKTISMPEFTKSSGSIFGTGDLTLTAVFEQTIHDYHTITFISGTGSGSVTKQIQDGEILGTMPVPSRDYYEMAGWYKSLNSNGQGQGSRVYPNTIVTADMTLYAAWTPITYTITYDTSLTNEAGSGHSDGMPSGTKYTYTYADGDYTPPTPVGQKTSSDSSIEYVFAGWSVSDADGTITGNVNGKISHNSHGNVKLTALWNAVAKNNGSIVKTYENLIPALINQERKNAGLSELIFTSEMQEYAETRAKELSIVYSHTRPDGTSFNTVNSDKVEAECIARGYSTAEDAVAGWMASSAHKALILTADYKTAGIGVYKVTIKQGSSEESYYYFSLDLSSKN